MSRWHLSPAARSDPATVWRYMATQWSPAQADRYVAAVRIALAKALDGSPLARPVDNVRSGYWRIKAGQHFCYFKRFDNGDLEVIRILHERMDLTKNL